MEKKNSKTINANYANKNKKLRASTMMDQNVLGRRVRVINGLYRSKCGTIYSDSYDGSDSYMVTLDPIPLRLLIPKKDLKLLLQ